jgi:hypothetical protein
MSSSAPTVTVNYGIFIFNAASGYPSPMITISKETQRDGAGRSIGNTTNITLEGKIFHTSGDATLGFQNLLDKEKELRKVFSIDGYNLGIACSANSNTSTFSGIKISRYSANKTENNWTTTIDYSIDLVCETIPTTGTGIFYVSSTQDDWTIEPLDENSYTTMGQLGLLGVKGFANPPLSTDQVGKIPGQIKNYPFYKVTRNLGAVGKYVPRANTPTSGESALINAKRWVDYHLADTTFTMTGIIANLSLCNFIRSINKSETEGSYRITDNWIAIPPSATPFIETFTIESQLDQTLMRTVTVNGTVKGLEPISTGNLYNNLSSGMLTGISPTITSNIRLSSPYNNKFDNAASGYSGVKNLIWDRANAFASTGTNISGFNFGSRYRRQENNLNPIPINVTEGFNPAEGSITYSWGFNNRPLNLITGSISENLTIDDNLPSQLYASIFVLGRKLGPVLQDMGTVSSYNRSVTLEVVMPRPTSLRDLVFPLESYRAITGVIDSLDPNKLYPGAIRSFVKQNSENWNPNEGRFVKTKAWEWTKCIYE